MFRTVHLSIVRRLFTVHSAMVYVIQVYRQLSNRMRMVLLESCLQTCIHMPLLSVQWINSWWWTDKLCKTCRISCQNKFVKLVHLVGFIIKKFVMTHTHMNVKCHDHSPYPPPHVGQGITVLEHITPFKLWPEEQDKAVYKRASLCTALSYAC